MNKAHRFCPDDPLPIFPDDGGDLIEFHR